MLSWNEIRKRSIKFSKEWEDENSEEAEAKSFWDDFFHIFGISRRRVAAFEAPVKKLDDKQGFIDLFWKGQMIVEHKSRGRDLDKAYTQALDYFHDLKESELPKYVLVSDFERFRLYDLEEGTQHEFNLSDLHKNIEIFGFIAGYQKKVFKEEDPVNMKAALIMGKLHDSLFNVGYIGHELEVFLVRLLFCLFAEDTGIFEKALFTEYIDTRTNIDGSDVGSKLAELFQILDIAQDTRLGNLDEQLQKFPYVNGRLFKEMIRTPSFGSDMRELLLEACYFDWSNISPAIFGSLFQSVMNQEQRRNLGAHYTSEQNIMKVIKPLFLDELWKQFNKIKGNKSQLNKFHNELANLKFLDPACGCGNFLVITYRELRLLELEILKIGRKTGQRVLNVSESVNSIIDVDQFYGIEIEEWPAKIAEVAMWLMDHQMNLKLSEEFGQYFARLPLKKSAKIVNGNALEIAWDTIVSKKDLNYIFGNPPFIGYSYQSDDQKIDMRRIFDGVKGAGVLDFVAAWYVLGAKYIQDTNIKIALVSTNSISQGEQAGILWSELFDNYNIKIHFAHRTFQWNNEAKGKAAVHVVIVGFASYNTSNKYIYEYEDIKGDPHEIKVGNINPYLLSGSDKVIHKRQEPICGTPKMSKGSSPTDGGNLILTEKERKELLIAHPNAKKYIKRYVGSYEYINGIKRYCLWLEDISPSELKGYQLILERLKKVKEMRLASKKKATQKWASTPTLFVENRQPDSKYLLIPRVSSENREYIPIGYLNKDFIISDSAIALPNATIYTFGVLTSRMHMTWVRYTAGRLKSDYRYSNNLVYNNFPWPTELSNSKKNAVEEKARMILNIRKKHADSSLADLYDPLTMPPDLMQAHKELDKTVDKLYRSKTFKNEEERIEFLFELHEQYTLNHEDAK